MEEIKGVFERLVQGGLLSESVFNRFSETGLKQKIGALHYFLNQGVIEEKKLYDKSQEILGVPAVSREDLKEVDRNVLMSFPRDLVEEFWVIPVHKSGNSITLAMFDPFNQAAKEEIKFFTNFEINPVFLPFSALQKFFDLYLNLKVDLKNEVYGELLTPGKKEDKKETKPPAYTEAPPQVLKAGIEVVTQIPFPKTEDKTPEPTSPVTVAVLPEETQPEQAPLTSPIFKPDFKVSEPIRTQETHPVSEEIAASPARILTDEMLLRKKEVKEYKEDKEVKEVKKEKEVKEVKEVSNLGKAEAVLTADMGREERTETGQVEFEVSESTIRSMPNLQELFISQYLDSETSEKITPEVTEGIPQKEDRGERRGKIIPEPERRIDKSADGETQLKEKPAALKAGIEKKPEPKVTLEPKMAQDYRLARGIAGDSRRTEPEAKREFESEHNGADEPRSARGAEPLREINIEGPLERDRKIGRESGGKVVEKAVEKKPAPSPSEVRPPRRKLKLNDVFDLLEKINNRDDIIDLYLKVSSKFYPRLVLFTVQKNNLKIWRETGFGLAKNQLKSFSLPLDLIPHFREVFENQTSFIGELGFGEGTKYFFNTFFFGKPKSSLLIPVVIQGKVGCIIYADNGRGTELNQGRSVTILEHLSTNVGLALGRVILEQKQKQTSG